MTSTSASRTWKVILTIAVFILLVGGVALWQRPGGFQSGRVEAQASIPGMETLQQVETALEAISQRITPAVVSIRVQHTTESLEMEEQSAPGGEDNPLRRFFDQQWPFGVPQPRTVPRPVQSEGSGVIIDPSGIILTAGHVVRGAERLQVTLENGDKLSGKVLGADDGTDLAVVKVNSGKPLPAAMLGDADTLKTGAFALAIGSPFGLEHSVSVGHVSALGRQVPRADAEGRRYRNLIQTDAAINRGNSGGPLIDIEGKVVGINTMIFTSGAPVNAGVGFAVAINSETKRVIETLTAGKSVQRGLLGVEIQDVDKALAAQYGVKEGAFVNSVMQDKPAAAAGIREEDVITRFGDAKIKKADDLVAAVEATKPGTTLPVTVWRDGKEKTLSVTITALVPGEKVRTVSAKPGGPMGVTVAQITPALVERHNLKVSEGVVVTAIQPTGEAARLGVAVGDVILKINNVAIKTVADYERGVQTLKKGQPAVIRFQREERKFTLSVERFGE
jgi:serine protease Do